MDPIWFNTVWVDKTSCVVMPGYRILFHNLDQLKVDEKKQPQTPQKPDHIPIKPAPIK